MSLLQFLIIITSVLFLFLSIDLFKRKKLTGLHTVIFLWWIIFLLIFALDVSILNKFGQFFWVARGADLLVYISIILLLYMYFWLLNSHTKEDISLSKLTSHLAMEKIDTGMINRKTAKLSKEKRNNYIFVVRAYNEALTIEKSLSEIIEAGFSKILVVNDWSTDETNEKVKKFQLNKPKACIVYLEHIINRWRGGGGASLKTAFAFIKRHQSTLQADWIVTFDPDGQMSIADMDKFIECQENNPTIKLFLWSRFIQWSTVTAMPALRKVILALSKLTTRLLYKSKVSDPHCGYRMIHSEILHKLDIQADSMHYANEINESIHKESIAYKEVPVHISYTAHSLGKGQQNSNSFSLAIQMLYNKFFFR